MAAPSAAGGGALFGAAAASDPQAVARVDTGAGGVARVDTGAGGVARVDTGAGGVAVAEAGVVGGRYAAALALVRVRRYDEATAALDALIQEAPAGLNGADAAAARADAARCAAHAAGRFDFATLRYAVAPGAAEQIGADFIGPLEVRRTADRGRGLYVTRAVAAGELLLVERAFAFWPHAPQSRGGPSTEGAKAAIVAELLRRVTASAVDNAALAVLSDAALAVLSDAHAGSRSTRVPPVPDAAMFRSGAFLLVPVLSGATIAGIIDTNAFAVFVRPEPDADTRAAMARSLLLRASHQRGGGAPSVDGAVNEVMGVVVGDGRCDAGDEADALLELVLADALWAVEPADARAAAVNAANAQGMTSVWFAAALRRGASVMAALLAAGGDPDAADDCGRSALHHACGNPAGLATVLVLLDAGARVDAQMGHDGFTPLRWRRGHPPPPR